MFVKVGAKVDAIGGELETTPLNWAARSGHVHMCVLLIQAGADPLQTDIEGFATIHLAAMFGHSNVVAYLLVKGADVDLPDRHGVTPLMHACQRVQSRDPAQLLVTFNARLNVQDSKGNTALHYCVAYNNLTCLEILVERGASVDIKNNKVFKSPPPIFPPPCYYFLLIQSKIYNIECLLFVYRDKRRLSWPWRKRSSTRPI